MGTKRFNTIKPEWYAFPARIGKSAAGQKRPLDPTKPMVMLKTSCNNMKTRAKVKGRWHDNRHTFITGLAESGDETIRDVAGHVSKGMLKHESHIGMEAKRRTVEALVSNKAAAAIGKAETSAPGAELAQMPENSAKESTKMSRIN
jgi:integrase